MREIKFREYNSHWEKMYAPFTLINAITAGGISDRYNKHSIFMQYTGLKDKNGKEIYEGDILNNGWVGIVEVKNGIATIEDNEMYGINLVSGFYLDTERGYRHIDLDKNVEVIGNIYENPELIKGEITN